MRKFHLPLDDGRSSSSLDLMQFGNKRNRSASHYLGDLIEIVLNETEKGKHVNLFKEHVSRASRPPGVTSPGRLCKFPKVPLVLLIETTTVLTFSPTLFSAVPNKSANYLSGYNRLQPATLTLAFFSRILTCHRGSPVPFY